MCDAKAAGKPRRLERLPAWVVASRESYSGRQYARSKILSAGRRSRPELRGRLLRTRGRTNAGGCLLPDRGPADIQSSAKPLARQAVALEGHNTVARAWLSYALCMRGDPQGAVAEAIALWR